MITKEKYISLMEMALSAYSDEHIERYFNDVKTNCLKEHGFPRLTVCIGILLTHGKRTYLKNLFYEMMEFCCKTIPNVKAANDFSIREIIFCILELEKHQTFDGETLDRWKNYLKDIDPEICYNVFARKGTDKLYNWALFTGVSEYMRQFIGLNNTEEFVDIQIETQLRHLDENLMYKDAPIHPPMVYDLVSRSLFAMLLHFGYKGKFYNKINECLKNTGLITLKMQSVNGEIPFGGRSNQFVLNEGILAIIYEFEANRYAKEGNLKLASKFKSGIDAAIKVTEHWFSTTPIYHIKNRFPLESRYGCEEYGYFDKYMITTASWLYAAYLMCDETIPSEVCEEQPDVFKTSDQFHKLFMKNEEYSLEFDLDADYHYDASGLGRVHKKGAPSAICLSVPCPPTSTAKYTTNIDNAEPISLCPAIFNNETPIFASEGSVKHKLKDFVVTNSCACADLCYIFENGKTVESSYTLTSQGVEISVRGDGNIAFALPAFSFDGENNTQISTDENSLTVAYQGWTCKYTSSGTMVDLKKEAYNPNGYYKVFYVKANKTLTVTIEISQI